MARFKDQAWLDAYTDKDTVPDDVRAEGFHAMGAATKGWLSACLVDAMLERRRRECRTRSGGSSS